MRVGFIGLGNLGVHLATSLQRNGFDLTVNEKEMPKEPEKDFVTLHQHSYNEQKAEISNAIRILKMTDEETVNTSTYNAVAQYL